MNSSIKPYLRCLPGLIIKISCEAAQSEFAERFIQYDDRYIQERIFKDEKLEVLTNTYSDYPMSHFEAGSFFCAIEGCVYNSNIQSEAKELLSLWERGDYQGISNRVELLDGEFIILFYNKATFEYLIVNDSWGRLPIYYFSDKTGTVISREISFLYKYFEGLSYSKIELAFFLLFGYALGNNTLFDGVKKIPPMGFLKGYTGDNTLNVSSSFSMERLLGDGEKPDYKLLQSALVSALKSRISQFKHPSLSLSGGLDSRLLAGIWKMTGFPAFFTTFNRPDHYANLDVQIAGQIASALGEGANHRIIEMDEPLDADRDRMVAMKRGLNGQEMAFTIPYFQEISKQSDCSISGDGGDKFFVDLYPLSAISNRKQLIKCILKFHTHMELSVAAKLCGVSEADILQRLNETLDSYEISNSKDAYAAFQIRERGINWLFEGEDRNRYFLWSTSPYYSPAVIKNALLFDMKSKRYGGLFKHLFKITPGKLENLENPYWGAPPAKTNKIKWVHHKQRVKAKIPNLFLKDSRVALRDSRVFVLWDEKCEDLPFNLNHYKNLKLAEPVLNRMETLIRLQKKK